MANHNKQNYKDCSMKELRENAKAQGIQNYEGKTRSELITALGSKEK